ncbi:MAG: hypothetical protein RIR70_20 [Pseudomonadota bacterium]|jgi:hypothetical protein
MLRIDLNALSPGNAPSTPIGNSPNRKAASAADQFSRAAFFNDQLGRPDLDQLSRLLDHLFGDQNWAFTGSTALLVHAKTSEDAALRAFRVPHDADILVDDFHLSISAGHNINKDPVCNEAGLSYFGEKTEVLQLAIEENQPPLKVDLINSNRREFGGRLMDCATRIEGVPVLSLDTLIKSLQNRVDTSDTGPHTKEDLAFAQALHAGQPQAAAPAAPFATQAEPDSLAAWRIRRSLSFEDMEGSLKQLTF